MKYYIDIDYSNKYTSLDSIYSDEWSSLDPINSCSKEPIICQYGFQLTKAMKTENLSHKWSRMRINGLSLLDQIQSQLLFSFFWTSILTYFVHPFFHGTKKRAMVTMVAHAFGACPICHSWRLGICVNSNAVEKCPRIIVSMTNVMMKSNAVRHVNHFRRIRVHIFIYFVKNKQFKKYFPRKDFLYHL